MSPYSGAFEQLFCPGGGAFASSFSKNANSRGQPGGGGWALLELTDALLRAQELLFLREDATRGGKRVTFPRERQFSRMF